MLRLERRALEYVANTNGRATRARFEDDHEPVGSLLWRQLAGAGYVDVDGGGRVRVTAAGRAALDEDLRE